MPLEDEIAESISRQIAEEIDGEIMADLLVEIGWTQVACKKYKYEEQHNEIKAWLAENCQGQYRRLRLNMRFIFEDSADAAMFALRWL
jgi:hypothetical protein